VIGCLPKLQCLCHKRSFILIFLLRQSETGHRSLRHITLSGQYVLLCTDMARNGVMPKVVLSAMFSTMGP
jgi:hypothetical protein